MKLHIILVLAALASPALAQEQKPPQGLLDLRNQSRLQREQHMQDQATRDKVYKEYLKKHNLRTDTR